MPEDAKALAPAPPRENVSLILQNDREKFLTKIKDMQGHNLAERQQKELADAEKDFVVYLETLSWSYVGLSREQIRSFDEKDLRSLADHVYALALPRRHAQKILSYALAAIPLIGWIALSCISGINDFYAWKYTNRYRWLKKAYGEDYTPWRFLHPLGTSDAAEKGGTTS